MSHQETFAPGVVVVAVHMGGRIRPLLCGGQGKCKTGEVPQGICKTWEMCWAQQRRLMEVVKDMLWPTEAWGEPRR